MCVYRWKVTGFLNIQRYLFRDGKLCGCSLMESCGLFTVGENFKFTYTFACKPAHILSLSHIYQACVCPSIITSIYIYPKACFVKVWVCVHRRDMAVAIFKNQLFSSILLFSLPLSLSAHFTCFPEVLNFPPSTLFIIFLSLSRHIRVCVSGSAYENSELVS